MGPLSLRSLGRFSLTRGGQDAFPLSVPRWPTRNQMYLPTVALR